MAWQNLAEAFVFKFIDFMWIPRQLSSQTSSAFSDDVSQTRHIQFRDSHRFQNGQIINVVAETRDRRDTGDADMFPSEATLLIIWDDSAGPEFRPSTWSDTRVVYPVHLWIGWDSVQPTESIMTTTMVILSSGQDIEQCGADFRTRDR